MDLFADQRYVRPDVMALEPPPPLNGETRIILNAETEGLHWWGQDRPAGWAYYFPESGRKGYLPIRHKQGENLPIERVHDWLRDLRDVTIDNINTKFDLHHSRADGVDLVEGTGNRFADVAFRAALLDDSRLRFNLDGLAKDVLGWDVSKDKLPKGIGSEAEFHLLPGATVAPYAIRNVEMVHQLDRMFAPHIIEQGLEQVLALEEEVLPAVVEMEKNGTYIDVEMLSRWRTEARQRLEQSLWEVYKESGIMLSTPDSPRGLKMLFDHFKIPIAAFTPKGAPSFTDAVMREVGRDCPTIAKVRTAGHLADFLSKYGDKYWDAVDQSTGWLRFNLHQLRATRDAEGGDTMGTVSGRFSAAGDDEGGYNPQQVAAVEKQLERGWNPDYVLRKLFVPQNGLDWVSADAKQIEYRLFAHYANSARLLKAYEENEDADFHQVVGDMLRTLNPDLNRKLAKNINFMKIYGGGKKKFASMVCQVDIERVTQEHLTKANKINSQYDRMFPEVYPLLSGASRVAEQRGWVKTILGRRARLRDRFHSALNRIIQGSAADVNKKVLVEVYRARKFFGSVLRLTVHDEINQDMEASPEKMQAFGELLNTQYVPTKVKILWDLGHGPNWAEAK